MTDKWRRRELTPEDRALWEQVVRGAIPLQPEPKINQTSSKKTPEARKSTPPPHQIPFRPVPSVRINLDLRPDPQVELRSAAAKMDSKLMEKVRRGRIDPEARLDLHGLTGEQAHSELMKFVLARHRQGVRLLLIITGKGRGSKSDSWPSEGSQGILRQNLPRWLSGGPLAAVVLQALPAHQRHGGDGAFYVYLRRIKYGTALR